MLDFNWESTVSDVLNEHIYDKVLIKSWDNVKLYEGDAFDTIDGMLLSRPVAELHVEHVSGYEWANIRLCQVSWQINNLPSYDELTRRVRQLENELASAHEESDRFERWCLDEQDAYYSARQDEDMALAILKFALLKKAGGHKVKLRHVANDVAFALGYGEGFFDE